MSLALRYLLAAAWALIGADLACANNQTTAYGPPGDAMQGANSAAAELPKGIPLPLVEAVAIASREHPLVARGLADRQSRRSNLRGARWSRFPSLIVEGLAVTQGNQIGAQDGLAANVVLEQPLYTFGRINGAIDAASASLETSNYALGDTQMELALRTIAAYFDLALATRREEIMRRSLSQHEDLRETIRRRVIQQISPQADLELAISRTAQIEQELAAVAGLRSTSFSRLQELIGYAELDLGGVPIFDPKLLLPPEADLVAMALDCSPRLKAFRSTRKELDAERRVARSRLFPQIVGQASTNEITGNRVGLAVRLQTGNGLSQFAAVDAAGALIVSAEFELAANERDIREQVRVDYLAFEAGRDRALASLRATASSELVTDSYKRQFIAGRRTWLDVMNAVRESMSAALTGADAELGALAAYSRLAIRSCLWKAAPLGIEDEQ